MENGLDIASIGRMDMAPDRSVSLHPEISAVLEELNAQEPVGRPYDVAQLRRRAHIQLEFASDSVDMAAVVQQETDTRHVPLRIYTPHNDQGRAVIVYFHGGGWVTGTLELYEAQLRLLAQYSEATVVGVGYRPAPEQRFPGAELDADDALAWVSRHFGADRRVVVAGDSSGGHIAARLTQRAATVGNAPALQVLVYPILDGETASWSFDRFGNGGILGTELTRWYWQQYLGDDAPPVESLSLLRAGSLEGLPPTVLIAAGHDVLLAQVRAFGALLVQSGVDLSYVEHPDMIHGYLRWTGRVAQSHRTLRHIAYEIGRIIENGGRSDREK